MRIAILTNAFPPQSFGGAANIAHDQARSLQDKGFEVCIWTPEPYPKHQDALTIKTFQAHTSTRFADLSRASKPSRLIFHLQDLKSNPFAVEDIQSWKPDILITHNLTGCGWSTPRAVQTTGIKWIHILHDVQAFEPSGQIFFNEKISSLKNFWRGFWSNRRKSALGDPDLVVSPSSWLLNSHKSQSLFTNVKSTIIPNPAPSIPSFDEIEFDDHQTAIFVGRLDKDKGFDLLLKAWPAVKQALPNSKLIAIGSGPLRAKLNSDDQEINFLGQLEHPQVLQRIKEANVLVFTSRLLENYPTVLLEAVAMRKNIVAHNVGGVSELLDGYGYLVAPSDTSELIQSLIKALQQQPDTDKCTELIKKHDPEKIVQQWIEVIENL